MRGGPLASKATLKVVDRGAKKLVKNLGVSGSLDFGFIGAAAAAPHGNAEGLTVAQVAGKHEFGDPDEGVPRRSMIRDYVLENKAQIQQRFNVLMKGLFRGKTLEEILTQLGEEIIKGVEARVPRIQPPLSEATVTAKGHDRMLYETGQMLEALDFRIEVKRGSR